MLVKAALYKDGKKINDMNMTDISSYELGQEEFFWAAMLNPTENEIKEIFSKVKIHELALEDLIHGNQRSKVEEYDENLFTVLKQVEINKETGELDIGDVYVFSGENYVISIRIGFGNGFTTTRHIVEKNPKLLKFGAGYVLYSIIDAVVDRYFPIIAELEKELNDLENKIFDHQESSENKKVIIERLHKLKGKARLLRRCIVPLMDSISKLFGGRVPEICENLDKYFRDAHEHLSKLINNLDTLYETANSSIQTSIAILTVEDNKITKKLAAWAAIFAVVTFMAGVWGMNFKKMPELESNYGYPVALICMFLAAFSMRFKFKKSGWI